MSTTTARVRRKPLLAVMLTMVLLLLTACGGKVDTVLTLKDDGSGVRAMTITVSKDDMEKVKGGAPAVDGVIKKNIPAAMKYSGMSRGVDTGSTVYSFQIPFTDEADYTSKVIAVLGAGNVVDREVQVTLKVYNSVFKKGVELKENFASTDLFQWLVNALVKTGTVSDENKSNIMELGNSNVEIDGVKHPAGSQMRYNTVQELGFDSVTVVTEGLGTDEYTRTIIYNLPRVSYAADEKGFDEFFKKSTPEGGELTPPASTDTTWRMVFKASSPDDLKAKTNTALTSESTDFAISSGPDPEVPMTMLTTVVDSAECSAICLRDAAVRSFVVVPEGWQSPSQPTTIDDKQAVAMSPQAPLQMRRPVSFSSIDVAVDIKGDEGGSMVTKYAVPAADAKALGEGLQQMLTPPAAVGSIEVADGDDVVVYTTTVAGSSLGDLGRRLGEIVSLPDGAPWVSLVETDGGGMFSKEYRLTGNLGLSSQVYRSQVGKEVSWTITLPSNMTIEPGSVPAGASINGSTITLKTLSRQEPVRLSVVASTGNMAGWILVGALALVLVGAVVGILLLLSRRKKAQSASASESAATQQHPEAFAQAPGAVPQEHRAQYSHQPHQPHQQSQATPPPYPQSQATPPPYPQSQATPPPYPQSQATPPPYPQSHSTPPTQHLPESQPTPPHRPSDQQ
ncbi:hypothetical protein [Aestuariimicrobium ganziense]|uniref:hypothetical protein n=1 Tax=Aestuariimicrobium ganziense TaxID=2773677 RepID=UPI001941E0B8|nr:hypothetical protein [Aestuariimicrobium ganziense]